jgi:hypothetical protein
MHPRIKRESDTVKQMIELYCRRNHSSLELCPQCTDLLKYACQRLERCPFKEGKTTCARCPVHCYKSEMREQIRAVMRFAGPRMIYRHPIAAVWHIIDSLRKKPLTLPTAAANKKP